MQENKQIVWKKYFDEEFLEYDVDFYDNLGNIITTKEKKKIFRYPFLVVNTWVSKILSEEPKIMLLNKEFDLNIDFRKLVTSFLAYGKVIVVPYFQEEELKIKILQIDDVNFITQNDKLKSLSYYEKRKFFVNDNWEEKKVYCKWTNNNLQTLYTESIDDKIIEENTITINGFDFMPPFIINCSNTTNNGVPVYATATGVIDDLNRNDLEMIFDRELSRKEVLVPSNMIADSVKEWKKYSDPNDFRTLNKLAYVNNSRKYRIMPGTSGEDQKPIYVDGKFNPETYSSNRNQLLHLLSLHCGFGSRFLSYDSDSGIKTATEVVSEKSELFQNKKMHDKTLKESIINIIKAFGQLQAIEIKNDDIEILFSDNIIVDDEKKKEEAFELFKVGVIDQRTLLEFYKFSDEKINEIMSLNSDIQGG